MTEDGRSLAEFDASGLRDQTLRGLMYCGCNEERLHPAELGLRDGSLAEIPGWLSKGEVGDVYFSSEVYADTNPPSKNNLPGSHFARSVLDHLLERAIAEGDVVTAQSIKDFRAELANERGRGRAIRYALHPEIETPDQEESLAANGVLQWFDRWREGSRS